MKARDMNEVIGGERYKIETATLLAGDDHWDGHNFERHGRNTFLFIGAKGSYFAQHLTLCQGEIDRLEPLSEDEAITLWETLPEKRMDFAEAFPGVEIEEA
jgi:CO dehydrogenase/acetyl-CoA synthase epsilon subunit